jgi:flagellar biosynthesis regulator FlaF
MGSTWAVDLKDVGAVYPLLGWELIMVLIAVALWILWHILQIRQENQDYAEDIKLYGSKESIKKALDEHPV